MVKLGTTALVALAACVAASPLPVDVFPVQKRLALTGEATEMVVSWNTLRDIRRPRVYYGLKPDSLDMLEKGHSTTYPTSWTYSNHVKLTGLEPNTTYYYKVSYSDMDSSIYSFRSAPAVVEIAELNELADDVVSDNTVMDEPWDIEAAKKHHKSKHRKKHGKKGKHDKHKKPNNKKKNKKLKKLRPSDPFQPFVFAAVADLGNVGRNGLGVWSSDLAEEDVLMPPIKSTFDSLVEHVDDYDFVWHNGDIAYADNWLDEPGLAGVVPNIDAFNTVLNAFYDDVEPVSAYKPYMVGPGNHDINCGLHSAEADQLTATGQECGSKARSFSGFLDHFRMPSASDDPEDDKPTMWYSFDYYSVHYVQINTEIEFGEDGDPANIKKYLKKQAAWLKRDLESVDRSKTPWVIVSGHRPWYVAAKNAAPECQEAFEDIINDNDVDIVLFGHVHNYQRNTAIDRHGQVDQRRLNNPKAPWYILNGAGGQSEGLDPIKENYRKDYLEKKLEDVLGWGRVTVHNSTHLTYQFVASINGTVLDEATIIKDHGFAKLDGLDIEYDEVEEVADSVQTDTTPDATGSHIPMTTDELLALPN